MAVYGYCRVSTMKQAEDGESLPVQRRKITSRATEHGWSIDSFYIDRGVSGAKPLKTRSEGLRMLESLQSGDIVISTKLDRMFRSASDAIQMLEEFKSRGIRLFLLDLGGECTGDGISQMVFTILSAVAQFERERISERIRDVRDDMKQQGKYVGGSVPFGFRVSSDGTLKEVKKEQEAIEVMKTMKREQYSLRSIASTVQQKFDIKVTHVTVGRILKNS